MVKLLVKLLVKYLVMRIKMGALSYDEVVEKFPQFKDEIELCLEVE